MALRIATANPQGLLNKIKSAIDQRHVTTWRYETHGGVNYYTHTTHDKQWDGKAWLTPTVEKDQLRFNIVPPKGGKVTREFFGVYHGRFTEMVLVHFENDFTTVWTPSKPEQGDNLG